LAGPNKPCPTSELFTDQFNVNGHWQLCCVAALLTVCQYNVSTARQSFQQSLLAVSNVTLISAVTSTITELSVCVAAVFSH
jgi:hypothetical protein